MFAVCGIGIGFSNASVIVRGIVFSNDIVMGVAIMIVMSVGVIVEGVVSIQRDASGHGQRAQ